MAEIKRTEGQVIVDYMARDYDSFLRSMRSLIPLKLPEWTDYESEADFGNVLLQLFAHMGDILSYYQDRIANESFLGTAQTRRSIIHHLQLIGYRLSTAAPASADLRVYLPNTCTGTIIIRKGDAFSTKSAKDVPSVRFEYTANTPLIIDCDDPSLPIDNDPDSSYQGRRYFAPVPVEEGRLITDEVLGISDGSPNLQFTLSHDGLILRSLGQGQLINQDIQLTTQLGNQNEKWRLRETLAFSREDHQDFFIEIDENDRATVFFGDGKFGIIPPTDSIIRATYRVGGGLHGNVPAGSISTISDAPQLTLIGAEVTNPNPASGGADRESISHAVQHAPAVFRSFKRAVTREDYEALALEFSGVGKVRAEATNWNFVTLHVAPEGGGQVSDVLEANLLAYFEDKRMVSSTVEIQDVDYVPVFVTAEIGVKSYYDPEIVREQVAAAGGNLLAFEKVDFGRTIYLSKFYEAIEAIEGVAFVTITEFQRDSASQSVEPSGRILLDTYEIPVSPQDAPQYAGGIRVDLPEEANL